MARTQGILGSLAALTILIATAGAAGAAGPDCSASIESFGAELAVACPCDSAANRAAHVRCVNAKLKEWSACTGTTKSSRSCGPLPRACVGKLRKLAARSTCGTDEAVTCCVPRQHDCVGDPKPGDGKAEGTCSGSTKACDQVPDCKLPRCQLSPTVEHCTRFGGTVGKTKDCTNACAP